MRRGRDNMNLAINKIKPYGKYKRSTNRMNFKQKKAVNELVANGGSIASAMRKAGYSPRTARTPKKMTETKSYKEAIKPIVEQMEEERQRAIGLLKKKISKAKYRDLTDGIDKLTKNIQLLTGGKTEDFGISELSKQLNELITSVKNDGK